MREHRVKRAVFYVCARLSMCNACIYCSAVCVITCECFYLNPGAKSQSANSSFAGTLALNSLPERRAEFLARRDARHSRFCWGLCWITSPFHRRTHIQMTKWLRQTSLSNEKAIMRHAHISRLQRFELLNKYLLWHSPHTHTHAHARGWDTNEDQHNHVIKISQRLHQFP